MAQQMTAAQIAQNNANFFQLTNWVQGLMVSNDNVYKTGKTLTFTFEPTGGYARGIWVTGTVDVNVALATGGSIALAKTSFYGLFSELRVKLGNTIHQVHPYFFSLVNRFSNSSGQSFAYQGTQPQPWVTNYLFGSYNGSTTSNSFLLDSGDNIWTFAFYVPLQFEPNNSDGLVPLGTSANKLTLELDTAQNLLSTDGFFSPVIDVNVGTSGTNTVSVGTSVASTINCIVEYSNLLTLTNPTSRIAVPAPIIQQAVYCRDTVANYPSFGNWLYARFEEPYVFERLVAVLYDNYTGVNSTGDPGAFANQKNIQGIRLNYDGQTTALEYSPFTGGTIPFWMNVKDKYGNSFDQGIIPFDFSSGHDPKNPSGLNLLNAEAFTQARVGIQYTNPSTGTAPNGAYIRLFGQYLVPQAY